MEAMPVDDAKLQVVRNYLAREFPGAIIDDQYDFDRCARTFRIRIDKDSLLLKVGENFLDDNSDVQVGNHLQNWKIASILRENRELGIFVSNNPPVSFRRSV